MARPSLFGEPAGVVIKIRVTPEQRRNLERVAKENGTKLAGAIRDAVDSYVDDYGGRPVFRGPKPLAQPDNSN